MTFGIVTSGFNKMKLEDIIEEISTSIHDSLGNNMNLLPTTVIGQLMYIFAEREVYLWDKLEAVYNSQFLPTAEGVAFDNALTFLNMQRKPATFSTTTLRIIGDEGTIIPQGFTAKIPNSETAIFATDVEATVLDGNQKQTISFSEPPNFGGLTIKFNGVDTAQMFFNAPASELETKLEAHPDITSVSVTGSFATEFVVEWTGVDGNQEIPYLLEIGDNNGLLGPSGAVTVDFSSNTILGHAAWVEVASTATTSGPVLALSGTVTEIDSPLFGIDSVSNLLDADAGEDRETEAEARIRSVEVIQKSGTATPDKIRQAIIALDDVESCLVIENVTKVVDSGGRPASSYECVVEGGDEQEIGDSIWSTKPAGIETYGDITQAVTDSEGTLQSVKFSRPTEVDIWLIIELDKNTDPNEGDVYPSGGDVTLEANVLEFANSYYEIGLDVINSKWYSPIDTVPGIRGITVKQGTSAAPTLTDNIVIDVEEVAKFDSSRISIVGV